MKKIILSLAVIAAISFTACSDDDGDSAQNTCQTCDLELFDIVISSQYCDNGDGTMTVTTEGQEEVVSLEGQSFSAFITDFELIGTCN